MDQNVTPSLSAPACRPIDKGHKSAGRVGVTVDQNDEQVIQAWNEHRPYLIDLAFRMLGDVGAAEDVVQDAFARLLRARPGEIEDERGWLIVVTSRLCLDHIRSARSRRERPHDAGEIEFVTGAGAGTGTRGQAPVGLQAPADPADRITLDDDVQLALLVMLQRLSPAERVVFVLHDIFGVPFDAVAETLGRPAATCRQLARRARLKIEAGQGAATVDVAAAEHREVTEKFIAACASGDLNGLLEVLAPDVWGDFDAGPDGPRIGVVRGADRVARNLMYHLGPGMTLVTYPVAGQPALLGFSGHTLSVVLILTMKVGRIQAMHGIGDPRKLGLISAQLG
jgi:RNA polymerase sigma-70 factor, ECF subfamily